MPSSATVGWWASGSAARSSTITLRRARIAVPIFDAAVGSAIPDQAIGARAGRRDHLERASALAPGRAMYTWLQSERGQRPLGDEPQRVLARVAGEHGVGDVVDRRELADRLLELTRAVARLLVQPRVLHRHAGLRGQQ